MRWDDSASRSPRAPGSLPQGTHPRSEEPGHEEAYPGIRERKGGTSLPSTGDSVTWARRMNRRSTPLKGSTRASKLGRNRGGRECSSPERFAHGQRRTAQFAYAGTRRRQPRSWEVAWDSSREEPHERGSSRFLTDPPGKERDLPSAGLVLRTGGRGEVETDSKGFRSTATTEEGTRGRTRPTAEPPTGKPL